MSRTKKDLKSHTKTLGTATFIKPTRKMKPLALTASIISGKRTNLIFIDNDISQDGFGEDGHWQNAKEVKSIREQLVSERQNEKSTARGKINKQTKKDVEEALEILKDESPWIKIEKGCKMPKKDEAVDLWVDGYRLTNYTLVKNFNGRRGNNFFSPLFSGISVVRYDNSPNYTNATHWMYPPISPNN